MDYESVASIIATVYFTHGTKEEYRYTGGKKKHATPTSPLIANSMLTYCRSTPSPLPLARTARYAARTWPKDHPEPR